MITWNDFDRLDLRVGTIIKAEVFPQAKKPAFKLIIDFGELGTKTSSAQITKLYQPDDLVGRQIIAVVNFAPRQIANFKSECLVLGVYNGGKEEVVLLKPEPNTENGSAVK